MFEKVCANIPYSLCDCNINHKETELTVILAMLPELITHGFEKGVRITSDGFARGTMVVDWFVKMPSLPKCNVVTGVNASEAIKIATEASY